MGVLEPQGTEVVFTYGDWDIRKEEDSYGKFTTMVHRCDKAGVDDDGTKLASGCFCSSCRTMLAKSQPHLDSYMKCLWCSAPVPDEVWALWVMQTGII